MGEGKKSMTTAENKAVVLRYLEMWNTGKVASAAEILAEDYLDHLHPDRPSGPEAVKQEILEFREAFSEVVCTVEQIIGEGEWVAYRFVLTAIHHQPFRGYAASGKRVSLTGSSFVRLEKGKLVENWPVQDTLSWVRQLEGKTS